MKQVLVVNSSLALPPGKLAAQVAHASIAAFLSAEDAGKQNGSRPGCRRLCSTAAQRRSLIYCFGKPGTRAFLHNW